MGLRTPEFVEVRKKCILYPNDSFAFVWDLVISLVLITTCILTPLNFAFSKEFQDHHVNSIITICVDVFFFFDIIINFSLAY